MGYLRWVLTVLAIVLAALRGRGPLIRLARALRRHREARVEPEPVRVFRNVDLRSVSLDPVRSPYGGALHFHHHDDDAATHAATIEALRRTQERRTRG